MNPADKAIEALKQAVDETLALRDALGNLLLVLDLNRHDAALIQDYGMLGLDAIQRARQALGRPTGLNKAS